MHDLNPFRQLVRVQNVTTTDYRELVAMNDNGAGWVAETGSRTATTTPSFRNRKPTHGEAYAYLQCSNWALDDLQFNVQDFLVRQTSRLFAQMEQTAIVSGNGTARPTGFLNGTTVVTNDDASPQRSEEVLEYIASAASPVAVNYDGLIDLMHAVHEGYLMSPNVAWVMNRSTLADVRKLKDSQNQPLWQPSLIPGQPSTLLGFPVFTSAAMPTGAGNDVIAFGDWASGYLFVQRTDMRLIVDPVTNPGYHRFYIASRVGGIVLDNNAIKTLKLV
jgi:HK97 family phage major capsid protein